ncbi:hypothetical protein SEA_MABODAMACA_63 [Microbacterium phage Mabodamaca]|uniref:Uncharacterized protein n=1 Tax=Microbacterium phage Mabodamaca TaxID=3078574 RepID=A0AA96NIN2_9CAUD|nr:hypothetical protein SEA_MABODAMACA_63 [Microbacterium phage Mabodamaca]
MRPCKRLHWSYAQLPRRPDSRPPLRSRRRGPRRGRVRRPARRRPHGRRHLLRVHRGLAQALAQAPHLRAAPGQALRRPGSSRAPRRRGGLLGWLRGVTAPIDGAAIVFPMAKPEYPILTLDEATAQVDAAYEAKGRAADAVQRAVTELKRARAVFNSTSRALAQAEAALLAAERRSIDAA